MTEGSFPEQVTYFKCNVRPCVISDPPHREFAAQLLCTVDPMTSYPHAQTAPTSAGEGLRCEVKDNVGRVVATGHLSQGVQLSLGGHMSTAQPPLSHPAVPLDSSYTHYGYRASVLQSI